MHVLELNDSAIRLTDSVVCTENAESTENACASPGYAVVDGRELLLGQAAFRKARLKPRDAHNHFWYKLTMDDLSHPAAHYRHQADLVYAHVSQLLGQAENLDELIIAVPGIYKAEQLSLLLGIMQESPAKVVGMVDAAVAALSTQSVAQDTLLVDIQLHQTLISHVGYRAPGQVTQLAVESLQGTGLVLYQDRCARFFSEAFIEQARFDPMHNATSEQTLYDHIQLWLAALVSQPEFTAELRVDSRRFQARITQANFLVAMEAFYRDVEQGVTRLLGRIPHAAIVLSHGAAQLPGLPECFPGCGVLAENAVVMGCLQHQDRVHCGDDAVCLVKALPGMAIAPSESATEIMEEPAEALAATHVLAGHRALRLSAPLYLVKSDAVDLAVIRQRTDNLLAQLSLRGDTAWLQTENGAQLTVNGRNVREDTPLSVGDLITSDNLAGQLRVISAD